VCTNPFCSRKIFAERLTDLAKVYAQRTIRQTDALYQFGLELGGEAGARLAKQSQNPVSADTILRIVKHKPLPKQETPQLVGVDDFALKRGQKYGTIIIDLVNHRPLDLLPDRTAETLADWLRQHPGIEVVTRDRAGAYADGINQGAPEALQIADHFHLLLNLTEHAKDFLNRNKDWRKPLEPELTTPKESGAETIEPKLVRAATVSGSKASNRKTAHQKRKEERSDIRRERRYERYEQVQALKQERYSVAEIAREVQLDPRTVSRYLKAGQFPEIAQKAPRRGVLSPYENYLRECWESGEQQVKHLVKKLKAKGYRGSSTIVYDFVRKVLKGHPEGELGRCEMQQKKEVVSSCREGAWLLVANPEKLKSEEQQRLARLLETGEKYAKFYELA
jgi:hypothetical protein